MKRTIIAIALTIATSSAFASDIASKMAADHAQADRQQASSQSLHSSIASKMAADKDQADHQQAAAQAVHASIASKMAADKDQADKQQATAQAVNSPEAKMARDNMQALTQSKMASASNPVGAAPVGEALDGKTTNSSINQAAGSLPANMDVKTKDGVVKAGSLPADAQVAVGIDSVFSGPAKKGGHDHGTSSHSEHGTGNGGNNAANSNSAHGLGGGNHIGGGSAQSGSRNVGHW